MAENGGGSSSGAPAWPTISLPPRAPAMDNMFAGGASPGPMTLVSNFFNDPDSDCRSFSQLLAGAMVSPAMSMRQNYASGSGGKESGNGNGGGGGGVDFGFQHNRPPGLTVSQQQQQQAVFTVPPGLSPASLLDSPVFFSSAQGSFGFSNQQLPAQTTQAPSIMHVSAQQYASFSSAPQRPSSSVQPHSSGPAPHSLGPAPHHQMHAMRPHKAEPSVEKESSDVTYPDQRSQLPVTVDKPADDGYNWRKYGQKQVKGSEYPRSYYKCTQANCPVKKKVERSLEGQVTEIIYKGQHNHQPPQGNKRGKDTENATESGGYNSHLLSMKDQEFSQATQEQTCGSSESEEVGNAGNGADGKDEDEPESKRRNLEVVRPSEMPSNHRTVTEPRIIVQTTSEVDLLDDGYRWRKYGQKVVKGNPYPRSYYKCTTQGCNVRKHVERAATDPKAVITTYEGKHTHDVPAAKNSSHATANMVSQLRSQNNAQGNQSSDQRAEFRNNGRQGIASLRFKEEQMT